MSFVYEKWLYEEWLAKKMNTLGEMDLKMFTLSYKCKLLCDIKKENIKMGDTEVITLI